MNEAESRKESKQRDRCMQPREEIKASAANVGCRNVYRWCEGPGVNENTR